MTFDDIITCEPKLKLGEFIQLFLLGKDDKIYINLYDVDEELIYGNCRIIDSKLTPYYDFYISYLADEDDSTFCGVVIQTNKK